MRLAFRCHQFAGGLDKESGTAPSCCLLFPPSVAPFFPPSLPPSRSLSLSPPSLALLPSLSLPLPLPPSPSPSLRPCLPACLPPFLLRSLYRRAEFCLLAAMLYVTLRLCNWQPRSFTKCENAWRLLGRTGVPRLRGAGTVLDTCAGMLYLSCKL